MQTVIEKFMLENRYTSDGTIFFKEEDGKQSWVVQLAYNLGGGGAAFKVVKWATWKNEHLFLELQETNENPEMWGWKIATPADLVLYCKDQSVVDKINLIKSLIEFGYKGQHGTKESVMSELEWRFNGP